MKPSFYSRSRFRYSFRAKSGTHRADRLRLLVVGPCLLIGFLFNAVGGLNVAAEEVDFRRQVQPILAGKCFTCHGPDEAAREAGLRLDRFEDAVEDRGGYQAITPGDHANSEVWQRVASQDEDLRMPPLGPHEPLTPEQVDVIARWIDQGAEYQRHWAFVPPQRPEIPFDATIPAGATRVGDTPATPIDAFINRRLAEAGLEPGAEADRYALVRRVYLDLIGVPPSVEQADAFVSDESPLAYQRLVDRLLASPDYAERWARPWLDLARYADTNGYEKDRPRTIWPYRDWVLEAINADLPYDRFSILQLAGDMVDGAGEAEHVATGFHRNTMLNEEGGIDPQEFRFHAMNDRVATTGTVWMGITVGCAQCHTHKYDPITHTDYYAMFALLNDADDIEWEIEDAAVTERRAAIEEKIRKIERRLITEYGLDPLAAVANAGATDDRAADTTGDVVEETDSGAAASDEPEAQRDAVANEFAEFVGRSRDSAADWQTAVPVELTSTLPILRVLDDGSVLASGDVTKRDVYRLRFEPPPGDQAITAIRLEALPDESLPAGGPGMAFYEGRRGDFFLSELKLTVDGEAVKLQDASVNYGKISLGSGTADAANVIDGEGSTGWSTGGREGEPHRWVANFETPFRPQGPWSIELVFERHYAAPLGRFRVSLASQSDPATASPLAAEGESRLSAWKRTGEIDPNDEWLDRLSRRFIATADSLAEQRQPLERLRREMPEPVRTLVTRQRPDADARTTRRYHRGEYLQPKEVVGPAIPEVFAEYCESPPTNRYEFAHWLVSPANPLYARVAVDRAWRELFGRGIVHTAGDYGTQSESPTHPELLDYLATEFTSSQSIKRLHRELVLSDTYRRSVVAEPDVAAADPENRLLAAGPRRRLEGERIRDSLLAASGLLTRHWGGPSVFPPQPKSVTAAAYGNVAWNVSSGADRFRRSVYTYAKRTAPFAAFAVFDGPTGETCLPRRDISNSPLQALTLLNDAMFLEMAEALADDVLARVADDRPASVASELFRRLAVRPAAEDELAAILDFHAGLDVDEPRTAWVLVARALMNLDEVITTP